MKQYYSPFVDKKGAFISLSDIRFSHFSQLKENGIEEGYKVEYKSSWNDDFLKNHLCKTIASFANSEGGWLFVGIQDGTAECIGIKKLRADYSQIIAQKLITVSPTPKFESRFIKNPKDKQNGVLVIYIYEGINPPYVCNGTVYLRSGSNTTPIRSGRIEIDNLINKRANFSSIAKDFCVNDLVDENLKFPYCTIYIQNPYAENNINSLIDDLRALKKLLSETREWRRMSYSSKSVLCYNGDMIAKGSLTYISEYYVNGNVKLFCPLFCLNSTHRQSWADLVKRYNSKVDLSKMTVIDGFISYTSIYNQLCQALSFIKRKGYRINDYDITFEYKNVRNTVLFFRSDFRSQLYIDRIENGEFNICPKNEIRGMSTYFIDDLEEERLYASSLQLLDTEFAFPFGVDPDRLLELITESRPFYGEDVFTANYDY